MIRSSLFDKALTRRTALLAMAFISSIALAGALTGQLVFDLPPCIMCIYQRIPYAVVILLSLIGLTLPALQRAMLGLNGIAFAINTGLAFYHTGIEQRWWDETQGCKVSFDFDHVSVESLLSKITSAQTGSCADIPWVDPILGLSMANYNVALCAVLTVFAGLAFYHNRAR